jgi:hypothetical protein
LITTEQKVDFEWRSASGATIQANRMNGLSRDCRANWRRLNGRLNHQIDRSKSGHQRRYPPVSDRPGQAIGVKVIAGDANDGGRASRHSSREAAKYYSPRRKPWERQIKDKQSPSGAKESLGRRRLRQTETAPEGRRDNSPALQRWINARTRLRPRRAPQTRVHDRKHSGAKIPQEKKKKCRKPL